MKRIFTLLIIAAISVTVMAQETEEKKAITFSGYISNQMIFDTYNSVDSREGLIYLYPLPEVLDGNGDDINQNLQYEMLALSTRLRSKISGPDAFGAKTSGLVEIDFLGIGGGLERMIRMRHAMIKLDWGTANLITGQYWHPLFVNECFPKVISFAAGAPFQPINRSPQARLTLTPNESLQISGTIWAQGYHRSTGGVDIQRDAGLPAAHFQAKLTNGPLFFGGTAGYRLYKPSLVDGAGNVSEQTLGSFDLQGFVKFTDDALSVSAQVLYGQNMTNYVMIGSFGAGENPVTVPDFEYRNMNTLSAWLDVNYSMGNTAFGFFGGYTSNMGAGDDYFSLGLGRGENLDYLFRLSPRMTYTSGSVQLACEYMGTAAVYATGFDNQYKVTTSADMVMNHRLMFEAKYTF